MMDSAKSQSYGALEQDRWARGRRGQSGTSYQGGLGDEFQVPQEEIDFGPTTTQAALSAINRGCWSWWRAGLVVAASATAFSATVGIVHYASFAGTERPLAGPVSTVLSETRGQSVKVAPQAATAAVVETPGIAGRGTNEQNKDGAASEQRVKANERRQAVSPVVGVNEDDKPTGELTFTAMNEYNRRGDLIGKGYLWLAGHHLVEPYRATTLAVESPVDEMTYTWDVIETRNTAKGLGQFEGTSVEVIFEAAPEYTIVLLEKRADGTLSRSLVTNVYCKYVRREIRSLFDDERNEMFDAMKVRGVHSPPVHETCSLTAFFLPSITEANPCFAPSARVYIRRSRCIQIFL